MSEQTQFSLNNVRVNLSDIPETFSKKLKSFLTRQPDFNEEIHKLTEKQQKLLLMLEQQISQMNDSSEELAQSVSALSRENKELRESVNRLAQELEAIGRPVINFTTQGK